HAEHVPGVVWPEGPNHEATLFDLERQVNVDFAGSIGLGGPILNGWVIDRNSYVLTSGRRERKRTVGGDAVIANRARHRHTSAVGHILGTDEPGNRLITSHSGQADRVMCDGGRAVRVCRGCR